MLLQRYFQILAELLQDINGVRNFLDDIIFFGKDQAAHDVALHSVLKKLNEKGVKLSKEKCIFSADQLKLYGYTFGKRVIGPDLARIEAIVNINSGQKSNHFLE